MSDVWSIKSNSIFTRSVNLADSRFIKAAHPKTSIKPEPDTIQRILDRAWVAQFKIHGHRAQFHIPSDPQKSIIVYNRQGQVHKKELPVEIANDLRRIFGSADDWTVLDGEWLKPLDKIYIFDILKRQGELLRGSVLANATSC